MLSFPELPHFGVESQIAGRLSVSVVLCFAVVVSLMTYFTASGSAAGGVSEYMI